MPEKSVEENSSQNVVRSYPAPWEGQLVLACRKCQRKLKGSGEKNGIAKLAKVFKKRARREEDGLKLRVIQVSCLKLCPKGGVTVCTQGQLGSNRCSIVRTRADADALYEQCKAALPVVRSTLDHVQG